MNVSFLVPDINCPVLGPVTELARNLMPEFNIQIVGPDLGHGVCPMYRGAFPYTVVPAPRIYRFPDYFREARRLADAITGDIIIAVKAIGDTVPVALKLKRERGAKVVAYLDEWDGALYQRLPLGGKIKRWLQHAHHPLDDVYFPLVEKKLPQCDLVISTTTFLQKKFGGEIVHMGVDTDWFKPQSAEATAALRAQHGLTGKKVIVFGGVVRPHKGIELILDALVLLAKHDLKLVVVGPKNEHVTALLSHPAYQPYLEVIGPQPKSRMPEYLDMADIMIFPMKDNLLAQSQMPCKIFEAMAMAKPVITSDVADLRLVMDDCGWTVPPENPSALAAAISEVLADETRAMESGERARQRCIDLYSKPVTKAALMRIMNRLQ